MLHQLAWRKMIQHNANISPNGTDWHAWPHQWKNQQHGSKCEACSDPVPDIFISAMVGSFMSTRASFVVQQCAFMNAPCFWLCLKIFAAS